MKSKWSLLSLSSLIATLILEILPYGAVIKTVDLTTTYTEYFSYFALKPYGMGNIFPFLTAVTTVLVFVLALIRFLMPSGPQALKIITMIFASFAFVFSLFPAFGDKTVIGIIIAVLLFASVLIQNLYPKKT